jgi:hypothetical protein
MDLVEEFEKKKPVLGGSHWVTRFQKVLSPVLKLRINCSHFG